MIRPRCVGLPWYASKHYEALRANLADGAKLPPNYETWRAATEQLEGEVQRSGVEVIRIAIEPNRFTGWCIRNGYATDGAARAKYAQEMLPEA